MHQLYRENHVYGAFKLARGRLTFRTGDPSLTQRLAAERAKGARSTVWLLSADPLREVRGQLEAVELVKFNAPQQWQVVMKVLHAV